MKNKKALAFLSFLILTVSSYAEDAAQSRFVAGAIISHSTIKSYEEDYTNTSSELSYYGNGYVSLEAGYEFRLGKYFSLTPYLNLNRNGWSWDYNGHAGHISYFNPNLKLAGTVYIMRRFNLSFGGYYGRPFYFWGELDGESTTDDMSYTDTHSYGGFYSVGFAPWEHFRIGIIHSIELLESESSDYYTQDVQALGLCVTYMM